MALWSAAQYWRHFVAGSASNLHGWVQSRAARELGLTLRQIGYRIRKYGLARDGEDVEPEGDIQD